MEKDFEVVEVDKAHKMEVEIYHYHNSYSAFGAFLPVVYFLSLLVFWLVFSLQKMISFGYCPHFQLGWLLPTQAALVYMMSRGMS